MIDISVEEVSKRYTNQWIIKRCNLDIPFKSRIGISGINGSGKSTLMKMLSGYLSPSEGKIIYRGQSIIPKEEWYKSVSFIGPYTDVIQEYSLRELYDFHSAFKSMRYDFTQFKELLRLDNIKNKRIEDYSSGMKQKVQLALGIFSDTPILLLDEPTSYLDEVNKSWFSTMIERHMAERTIIIASNERFDFQYCDRIIEL